MKNIRLVNYFILLTTLLCSCKGCIRPKEPEFLRMQNINILYNSNDSVIAVSEAVFFNPNKIGAIILNTELNVHSNGIKVADISQTNNAEAKPESEFILQVNYAIDLKKLLNSQGLSGLISSALSRSCKLEFNGYCRIMVREKIYKIPISSEQTINFN